MEIGFRVQLMQTSDREEANHIRRMAILRFDKEVYMVFEEPYYKVRLGNFATADAAEGFRKVAEEKGFPDAWVVGSKVKL